MIFPSFSLTPGASAPFCRSQGSLSFRRCKDTMFPKYRPSEKETVCVNGHVLLICINVLGVLLTLLPFHAAPKGGHGPAISGQAETRLGMPSPKRGSRPANGAHPRRKGACRWPGGPSRPGAMRASECQAPRGVPGPRTGHTWRGAPTTKGSVSVAKRAKQARGDARKGATGRHARGPLPRLSH